MEASFYNQVVNRHGVHVIGGPLLVGGATHLLTRTGLIRDRYLRNKILNSDQRFRDYLKFHHQAVQIAVDFFRLTAEDEEDFIRQYFVAHIAFGQINHHAITTDNRSAESEVDNISTAHYLSKDPNPDYYLNTKRPMLNALNSNRGCFAWRKGLAKLDFIQSNSEPEEVLKRIKSLTGWSELTDRLLRRFLQSHMNLLKELERSKQVPSSSSICEYESAVLEKINLELSSSLGGDDLDKADWRLMDFYYNRMRLWNVARECATVAQNTGVILVEEALPLRVHSEDKMLARIPKVRTLPMMKQNVKQALERCMGTLQRVNGRFGSGAPRRKVWQLVAFSTLASLATLNSDEPTQVSC